MNKSESLDEHGFLTAAAGEAHKLGFGDPVAISAETGLGMAELYEILRPLFEEYMFQLRNSKPVAIYVMVCSILTPSQNKCISRFSRSQILLNLTMTMKEYQHL